MKRMPMTAILGISAYYHDSAAAIVLDGQIIAAAQEERFTRKKQDSGYPHHAVNYCLSAAGINLADVDKVVFYDKPLLKFERLLETYLAFAPKGFDSFCQAIPRWMQDKLFQKQNVLKELSKLAPNVNWQNRLLFSEHHLSHAASAFYPSPFDEALILTLDGVGEWTTTSLAIGSGSKIDMLREIRFPHSIGMLYSAFTYYTGFKVNSGEYKVMGLAPYGEPRYVQTIYDHLIEVKNDGSFWLNMDYFDFCTGLRMVNERFEELFGGPARQAEAPLTQKEMDLAASIQVVTEEVMLKLTRAIVAETGITKLCLAGGVALNCVANGKILRDGHVKHLWIQPAAGDAGGALGAALVGYYKNHERVVQPNAMNGSFLGPVFSQTDIEQRLMLCGAKFDTLPDDRALINTTAQALADGKAVGWFQGKMEFGPRALGARSILGDARSASMQKLLNLKVKYRESFRPFAPSILRDDVQEWFDLETDSPYMLLVADVADKQLHRMSDAENALFGIDKLNIVRSTIPAVTHVDYSARVQTVHAETNPKYHALISQFKAQTGCPVVVNTSFNVRGEPIVCTPEDAFRCFMGTDIEVLVIGNCYLEKDRQNASLAINYKNQFELD